MTSKKKKLYRKPRLTQVRLEIQSPIMVNCMSSGPTNPDIPCNVPNANCADTSL